MAVLGISVGTRRAGIAVMRNGELIDYKVKSFKGAWSMRKQKEIIQLFTKYFEFYGVTHIAIKTVHPLHSSKTLDSLIRQVCKKGIDCGIKNERFTLKEMKHRVNISPNGSIMEYIHDSFPELRREYCKEKKSFHPYYIKMFEAIVLAKIIRE